jgi:hypothetical protein
MTRGVALVILALTLNAAPLHAQTRVFTVTVRWANVHEGPAVASPVIGHVSRHTVLKIARQTGNWAAVFWRDSPNGLGYLHVTMGRIGVSRAKTPAAAASARPASTGPAARQGAGASAPKSAPAPAPVTTKRTPAGDRVPSSSSDGSHIVGVGGVIGPVSSWGATARWWRDTRVGMQAALTRNTMTSDTAPGRVTSLQIEPGIVYPLFDHIGYVRIRPYVGSALSVCRQTLKDTPAEPTSDTGFGWRIFGGTELTFAGVRQFGLSAEVGYRRQPAPYIGFEPDHFGVAVAGHWYIK